jgi:hypothetical protein
MTKRDHIQRFIEGVAIVLVPSLLAYTIGRYGAEHAAGALIVLLEPLLLLLGVYVTVAIGLHRQWLWSASIAMSMGIGAIALHLPAESSPLRVTVPETLRALRGCAVLPQSIRTPVRVVTWTVEDAPDLAEAIPTLSEQRPDLVVLIGETDPASTAALAERLGGELKTIPGATNIVAIVRGSFQYCGGEDDLWTVDLPGAARLALVFPFVQGAGTLPVMIVQLPKAGSASGLGVWASELVQGVEYIARAVQMIGARRMLVVGNFQAPNSVQRMAQPLRASGLLPVRTPPNWPTEFGGIPFPTLHALDQVWAGPAWHAQRARALGGHGQARAPLLVDLTPIDSPAG